MSIVALKDKIGIAHTGDAEIILFGHKRYLKDLAGIKESRDWL